MPEDEKTIDDNGSDNNQDELAERFDEVVEQNDEPAPQQVAEKEVVAAGVPAPAQPVNVEVTNQPAVQPITSPVVHANTPGVLLMQWLVSAFFGLFALALIWLTVYVVSYFVTGSDSYTWGEQIAYPLAAVIVLLLIAVACDAFYVRKEPAHKTGGASVIMLVHAVTFALFGIAALITAVFSVINMTINSGVSDSGDGSKVALYSALIMLVVYALLMVRTVFASKVKNLVRIVWVAVFVIAAVVAGMGIAGPAYQAALTKQDRLIEAALPTIAYSINDYANTNGELPGSIGDVADLAGVNEREQVKLAISKGLVTYTPNIRPATTDEKTNLLSSIRGYSQTVSANTKKTFYYQLCTTYQQAKKNTYGASYASEKGQTTVNTDTHDKGKKCYDVQTKNAYETDF